MIESTFIRLGIRSKLTRSARRRQSGTAMVEMIIVLPVLLLLLFGIVEFSILFSRLQTVTNAAREGAREAVVFRLNCNSSTVQDEVRATVQSYTSSGGVIVDPSDISVSGACTGSNNDTTVQVVSNYAFQVVGGFAPGLTPSVNVTGTSVMRNE
jgi:Flp pilus assembly protein TadG